MGRKSGGCEAGHHPEASPSLSLALWPCRPRVALPSCLQPWLPLCGGPRPPPAPHTLPHGTCGEPWLGWGLLHGHGEGGGCGGGLCPGQGPVPAKGHGDASSLHGRLVVPQLVDPLLLQEEGLLQVEKRGHSCFPASPVPGCRATGAPLPDPPPNCPRAPSAKPHARLLGRSLPSGPGGWPARRRPRALLMSLHIPMGR